MIIRTNLLFPGIAGMTIWPFILIRPGYESPRLLQHERIHLRQQIEMLLIPFYVWYLLEFLIRLPKSCLINYQPDANWFAEAWDNAYRAISFEREAFAFDRSPGYLKTRKHFYWLRYVLK
jgi:hypothetical protein